MNPFETTMQNLLTDLKATVMNYARSNEAVTNNRPLVRVDKRGSWVKGFLTPQSRMPAIAFLPQSERIMSVQTGNRQRVRRTVHVEVFDKGLERDVVVNDLVKIEEDCREALKSNPWIRAADPTRRKTVYNYELLPTRYPETSQIGDGIVASAAFDMVLDSYHTLGDRNLEQTWKATETSSLSESIVAAIQNNAKAFGTHRLREVQAVDSLDKAVHMYLPAVGVHPISENWQHVRPGAEDQSRVFEVWVVSKLIPKEAALDQVLDLTEEVKNVLQTQFRFGGKAVDSELGMITYGVESTSLTLSVRMELFVFSIERMRGVVNS